MSRIVAMCLIFLLGLFAPAAGGSVRVCVASWMVASVDDDCCSNCGSDHGEHAPCCVELAKLPDAQPPAPMPVPPDVPVLELDWQPVVVLRETIEVPQSVDRPCPIRGPTSDSARRSLLAIWRL
ncbi:hypothetical protein [Haloferula sargassicola]|uniref:Secreted protein n=1 Tax=Haloferula sargassicola TaxID=490096 RepID=A0ABP9UJR0_9BACT